MAERSFMQKLQNIFKFDDKETVKKRPEQYPTHFTSEHLAFINIVKSELQKIQDGGKSFIGDLKALKADTIPYGIILCEYMTNIMLGNPVDDSLMEFSKIIAMLATLPSDSQFGNIMTKIILAGFWKQLPHPPVNYEIQAGYHWRTVDGSYNNLTFADVGRSGKKYIQHCVSKRRQVNNLPEPGLIFDKLLKRCPDQNGCFRGNEGNISSNLFYFATFITHDIFNTDPNDKTINATTSYLDLSSLYGWTNELQKSVRTGNNGLLNADQYADMRFGIQPAGLTALLVLFSRNHNYLAENLLKIDENGRFSCLSDEERDEALFQTARLINERTYINIILHDYIRVILGVHRKGSAWTLHAAQDFTSVGSGGDIPKATGNQCSIEFNFLYRWHHATSIEDEKWIEDEFSRTLGDWQNMDMKTMFQKFGESKMYRKEPSQLVRRKDGTFDDKDLARALINGCKYLSGAFGGKNTPSVFRNIEISGILHARNLGICTLNEYRLFLKLKPYNSFHDLNPELADELAKLYETIDDVELYPGLLCERAMPAIGSGMCINYTTGSAILFDAIALVRGDRFHTQEATHFNLTNFGMEDSEGDDNIDYGALIGRKLIVRHLGSIFKPNSIYALFPFTLPSETWNYLGENRTDYDFTEPLV